VGKVGRDPLVVPLGRSLRFRVGSDFGQISSGSEFALPGRGLRFRVGVGSGRTSGRTSARFPPGRSLRFRVGVRGALFLLLPDERTSP